MRNRLNARSGEVIDRGTLVHFRWQDTPQIGFAGDTIASALAAAGIRVFTRSFKYHRPRGLLTADFLDPHLMVQVGDEPNVRAGHRLVTDGMDVRAQNAWPSLEFDAKSANRLVGRFLSPGFYYKTFMGPRRLWPTYQRVLRRFGTGGAVSAFPLRDRYDHRFAHPDVVVAGGGPSGMAAAIAAADAGASVMLVEENHELGGHLRWGNADDLGALGRLREEVEARSIEVLTDSVVAGRYDGNWVSVLQRSHPHVTERLIKARAKALVVAAGTIERPYVFEGNDLPGVILSTAARRLINLYAVRPGTRAVVFSANPEGDAAAADLGDVGVAVTRVDARQGRRVARATGRGRVHQVEFDDGSVVDADLLVTATGWTTPTALLNMAGDRPTYSPAAARFLPGSLPDDVLATGGIVGDGSTDRLVEHGRATGAEAARRALRTRALWRAATPTGAPSALSDTPAAVAVDRLAPAGHIEMAHSSTHGFVDFSEDVTSKDLAAAAAEGYDSMELAKRYTTATMGPIQGKLEVVNAVAIHAEATGRSVAETGTTTWRPPHAPISLGALAGRNHEPVRASPMQTWHEEHGARPLVAGLWIRPDRYGDPADEVRNVRTKVGIIDVSPLGKIDLRGPDVPELLEFVYTNRWQKLAVGSVRYGVMCTEDGVVFDDGVVGRLAEDRWLMTTTSGGAGRVWNWIDDWIQTRGWDVQMTAVTDGYASINVAGPDSRELVGRLTDLDLSPDAFPYMRVRTGAVAGVDDCIVWRIGFTGELSYEIHVGAGYGLHLWQSLLETGADLGAAPFGIEAQRIMRLEKGHFIVGQDTDGLTQAYTAGIDWAIRLDKDDFAGKPELAWQAERSDTPQLVAIQPHDPAIVPAEASQIIEGTAIVGRITSSRFSPTLERSICLGQVAAFHAAAGTDVTIRLPDGTDISARVMEHHAHFDPAGERLRG